MSWVGRYVRWASWRDAFWDIDIGAKAMQHNVTSMCSDFVEPIQSRRSVIGSMNSTLYPQVCEACRFNYLLIDSDPHPTLTVGLPPLWAVRNYPCMPNSVCAHKWIFNWIFSLGIVRCFRWSLNWVSCSLRHLVPLVLMVPVTFWSLTAEAVGLTFLLTEPYWMVFEQSVVFCFGSLSRCAARRSNFLIHNRCALMSHLADTSTLIAYAALTHSMRYCSSYQPAYFHV